MTSKQQATDAMTKMKAKLRAIPVYRPGIDGQMCKADISHYYIDWIKREAVMSIINEQTNE